MAKKGYPGLILVPPSDRTIVRRRVVRWSLFILAILWAASTFNIWLSPSNTRDCESRDTQGGTSNGQENCDESVQPIPEAQPRQNPVNTSDESQNKETVEPTGSTETPASIPPRPATESTTDDRVPKADIPAPTLNTSVPAGPGSSVNQPPSLPAKSVSTPSDPKLVVQASTGSTPTKPANPSTGSPTTTDHKITAQASPGTKPIQTPPQPVAPIHTAADRKATGSSGNGATAPHTLNPPAKSASASSDHKPLAHTSNGSAPNISPSAGSASATPDHKILAHAPNGTKPTQTPIAPTHTAADRKATSQQGNGSAVSHTLTPAAKSASTPSDQKLTARTPNSSAPTQTASPTGASLHLTTDHKVLSPSGNGSSSNQGLDQSGFNTSEDARLAEEGDAFAQYRLGRLYAQQSGRRSPDAVKWYRKASAGLRRLAEAGNGQAMYILGVMYAYGRGVSRNTDEARLWLNQAVERKVSAARPVLASLEKD